MDAWRYLRLLHRLFKEQVKTHTRATTKRGYMRTSGSATPEVYAFPGAREEVLEAWWHPSGYNYFEYFDYGNYAILGGKTHLLAKTTKVME